MTVYLVGAGPGDPDLLTRRGARLLASADVVVVDRLVDRRLLDDVRADARIVDVGKHARDGNATVEQETINDLLVAFGREGSLVVRLKGGDPYLFGRGGEEVDVLEEAGVPYEVVPGVTSAFSVPALAGIPVTHRGVSSTVTVISGHSANDVEQWRALPTTGTVVFLMAVANRSFIADTLVRSGRDPQTPVAVIEAGSTPKERRTLTTLADLGDVDVCAPAVIVIGEVARRLRE